VNFVTEAFLKRAMEVFRDYQFKLYRRMSWKRAQVSVAHIQGLEKNVHFCEQNVTAWKHNAGNRPIVLSDVVTKDADWVAAHGAEHGLDVSKGLGKTTGKSQSEARVKEATSGPPPAGSKGVVGGHVVMGRDMTGETEEGTLPPDNRVTSSASSSARSSPRG
jgi:hypothetical protein